MSTQTTETSEMSTQTDGGLDDEVGYSFDGGIYSQGNKWDDLTAQSGTQLQFPGKEKPELQMSNTSLQFSGGNKPDDKAKKKPELQMSHTGIQFPGGDKPDTTKIESPKPKPKRKPKPSGKRQKLFRDTLGVKGNNRFFNNSPNANSASMNVKVKQRILERMKNFNYVDKSSPYYLGTTNVPKWNERNSTAKPPQSPPKGRVKAKAPQSLPKGRVKAKAPQSGRGRGRSSAYSDPYKPFDWVKSLRR